MVKIILSFIVGIFLCGVCDAQPPGPASPTFYDVVQMKHYTVIANDTGSTKEKSAVIYLSSGFGKVLLDPNTTDKQSWKMRDDNNTPGDTNDDIPVDYVWFKYDKTQNDPDVDQHWFCTQQTWNNYIQNQNVSLLEDNSWHFSTGYLISSDYTPQPPLEQVVWTRTEFQSVGYTTHTTLFVIRVAPNNPEKWQWSARGTHSTTNPLWRAKPTRQAAEQRAEEWFMDQQQQ